MTAFSTSLIIIIVICGAHLGCQASYTFTQTYHSFSNAMHVRADGRCCDAQGPPPCSSMCDNRFTVCVRYAGQALPDVEDIQSRDCPLGFFETRTFDNSDDITFNTSVPVLFTGDIWPASFQLLVQAIDEDTGNPDDFIDVLVVDMPLSPSPSPTPPSTYTSNGVVFSFVISFQVECSENMYGDNCTILCEPRDDTLGHYTCGSAGERVCLEGYGNPDSNCTDCAVADGCLNGYCREPGDCLCNNGFGGELCSQDLRLVGSGEESGDSHVTGIVVGVVVGVLVLVTVVTVVTVLLVWKRREVKRVLSEQRKRFQIFGRSHTFTPGDNPVYLSSAVIGSHFSQMDPYTRSSAGGANTSQTPRHKAGTGGTDSPGKLFDDEIYNCSQPIAMDTTPGVIDPYGSYGEQTILRVAQAPPLHLFDAKNHKKCILQPTSDNDDSDCQSEYYI